MGLNRQKHTTTQTQTEAAKTLSHRPSVPLNPDPPRAITARQQLDTEPRRPTGTTTHGETGGRGCGGGGVLPVLTRASSSRQVRSFLR